MAFVALLAVALLELGPPWDELNLDSGQRQRISKVLLRYRPQVQALEEQVESRTGSNRTDTKRRLDALVEKRDKEACRSLDDDQRAKYDEIRKWMADGVPLGEGLYRSYEITETGPLEDGVERPNRIRFSIVNHAPHAMGDITLEVNFIDRTGAVIHTERPHLDRIDAGQSRSVVVHYQYVRQWRQRYSKPQVELLSAQPLP